MGLDTVEMVLWAEKTFQLSIPDEDVTTIETVGAFVDYIHYRLCVMHGFNALPRPEIFARVKHFLVSEFNVEPGLIRADARFVKDMGLE